MRVAMTLTSVAKVADISGRFAGARSVSAARNISREALFAQVRDAVGTAMC